MKSDHGFLCQDGHSITFNHLSDDKNTTCRTSTEKQISIMLHNLMYASSQRNNHETAMQKKKCTHNLLTPVEFQRLLNPKTNDCEANTVKFDYEVVSTNYNGNGKLRLRMESIKKWTLFWPHVYDQ